MKKMFVMMLVAVVSLNAYVVQKGDTLWGISKKTNLTVQLLRELNPEIKGDKIKIGQVINTTPVDFERLFSAFVYVESRGRDDAIGDKGMAVGCIQLWPVMVDEVNRLAKTSYTYNDRLSRVKSKEMFMLLMKHKKVKTLGQAIKVWNPRSNGKKYREAYRDRK